ncbi:hypothetical protein [Arthrobacter sp. M4]|uniref:hypothetical protein n=1 Tax=Arthrobacter sp. M4 TaxID=218160 RepID=UPI001CDD1F17|nr:hypothetical protein [Arthrobacter sp. M4]MCA4132952.1 hypothetical protein [Arthrobacter sp. M4]
MKVQWEQFEGSVEIAPGVTIWSRAKTTIEPYKGYRVDAEVSVAESGRVEIDSLTVSRLPGGEPVTGEALRKVAVQSIIRDAVKTGIQQSIGSTIAPGTQVSALGMIPTEDAVRLKHEGPTAETLEWVGRIYRVSELIDSAPTKAVEETFGISRSTAGAWIGRARAAGHIPPVDK